MNRRAFCEATVRAAGEELRRMGGVRSISLKDGNPKDIVTNVDVALNSLITGAIGEAFPGEAIYSEEHPTAAGAALQWVIDPIDGTANFSRDIPHFAIMLGVLENGEPRAGAVYNPVTNELFSFEKGNGAFLNDTPIHVSSRSDLKDASVILRAGRNPALAAWGGASYTKLLQHAWKTNGFGCSGLDICFVAAGRAEACIYGQLSALDCTPALGILREAGGVATSKNGEVLAYTQEPQSMVVANSPAMAGTVTELLFT